MSKNGKLIQFKWFRFVDGGEKLASPIYLITEAGEVVLPHLEDATPLDTLIQLFVLLILMHDNSSIP